MSNIHDIDHDPVSIGEAYLHNPEWTRAIIDSIGDGIIVADCDGNFLLFNPAAERLLGVGLTRTKPEEWSETYGVFLADGTTPCPPEYLPLAQAIRGETIKERELVIRNPARNIDIWLRTSATPIFDSSGVQLGGVVVFHDITEQKQGIAAMKRAERLISIGTLAAGVAHEINNPVGAMVLTAEDTLLRLGGPDSKQIAETSLKRILAQAQRCSEIVKGVLKFANQQTTVKSVQDLRAIVDHAAEIIRHRAEVAGLKCELQSTAADGCEVWANATELSQVVVNLLANAIEASEAGSVITVSITNRDECLELIVQDCGCGIESSCHDRIFDAFYTTRPRDDATGLGLSIVHAIVADHGGTICVKSRPHEGARFTVRLPRVDSGRTLAPDPTPVPQSIPDGLHSNGTK